MMETKNRGEVTLPYDGMGLIDINSSHDVNRVSRVMSLQKNRQYLLKQDHNQNCYSIHFQSLHILGIGMGIPPIIKEGDKKEKQTLNFEL